MSVLCPKYERLQVYILTYICLASKWPEAIPFRNESAGEVAEALIAVITIGFPFKILLDRGKVFLPKVLEQLYKLCCIDSIQTSPYRPQSNGTLKPMLVKATE